MFSHSVFGKGTLHYLFAIGGYQQSEKNYSFLSAKFGADYTIILIHLPKESIENFIANLCQYIHQLKSEYKMSSYSMLAYSQGGRILFHCMPMFIPQAKSIIFIGPDGFHKQFWNQFVANTFLGRKLFEFIIHKPQLFFLLLRTSYNLGIINSGLYAFCKWQMRDETARKRVYHNWLLLKDCNKPIKKIAKQVQTQCHKLCFIFGDKDDLVPMPSSKKLLQLFPSATFHLLPCKHEDLINEGFVTIQEHLMACT